MKRDLLPDPRYVIAPWSPDPRPDIGYNHCLKWLFLRLFCFPQHPYPLHWVNLEGSPQLWDLPSSQDHEPSSSSRHERGLLQLSLYTLSFIAGVAGEAKK